MNRESIEDEMRRLIDMGMTVENIFWKIWKMSGLNREQNRENFINLPE